VTLRQHLGDGAFRAAVCYGATMHLQHDAHVWAFNYRRVTPLYDSYVPSTRIFWRLKLGATAEQAQDPRPFLETSR